jgi:hypothetical protein
MATVNLLALSVTSPPNPLGLDDALALWVAEQRARPFRLTKQGDADPDELRRLRLDVLRIVRSYGEEPRGELRVTYNRVTRAVSITTDPDDRVAAHAEPPTQEQAALTLLAAAEMIYQRHELHGDTSILAAAINEFKRSRGADVPLSRPDEREWLAKTLSFYSE